MTNHSGDDGVTLRDTVEDDLPTLFEQQRDPEAVAMAAFGAGDPDDRAAFMERRIRFMADPSIINQTIVYNGEIAGIVALFEMFGHQQIGYWVDKPLWGKGIATRAVALFLEHIPQRPLYAHAAKDNLGSLRVLEKNGFVVIDEHNEFSERRGKDVVECVLRLDGPGGTVEETPVAAAE